MLKTLADSEEVTVEELISALPWQFNWFLKVCLVSVRSSYRDTISFVFFVWGEIYLVFHAAFVVFAVCFL